MIIGLVGKPSAGKSTFFKAATLAQVEIANYPFTTIAKNEGISFVRVECIEKEFNTQCQPRVGYCLDGIRFVPVEIIDVAGLVPGAHLGKGKGNQFLDDLRQADVLIHVIDVSGSLNTEGEPVDTGSYDPAEDVAFLETEIDMWYFSIMKKNWDKFAREIQQEKKEVHKEIAKQLSGLGVTEEMTQKIIDTLGLSKENIAEWDDEQLKQVATELRKQTKPMIIACNKIDVPGAAEKFAKLQNDFPDLMMITCSAESEVALKEAAKHEMIKYIPGDSSFELADNSSLSDKQKQALEFIKANILDKYGSTGVQEVLDKAVFDLLKYIAVFPGGVNKLADSEGRVLPDCFLLPQASTALDFAYKVHTDLGENFIRAIDARTKQTVGKDHVLKHRDAIEIVADK